MKIWFDISNSPHVNMFYDLIKDLESEGHEVIITSRPLANTIALLNQKGMTHTIVGKHYGKKLKSKLIGYPVRVLQLYRFLKKHQPDIAVSQSSFHSPLVAKLLGIPSIYTNDNEHALGNKPCFLLATKILIPENLDIEKIKSFGVSTNKIIQYPGVKEGIYLYRKGEKIQRSRINHSKEIHIYIRPEPQTAQYYNAKTNFLDEMILELQEKYKITILTRDENQTIHYQKNEFLYTSVPRKPLDFETIASDCTLFIGAGGSMTREMAILGIPTISVYQDKLLDVDSFLLRNGIMIHDPDITATKIENYILNINSKKPSIGLMKKGELAYHILKNEILKTNLK